MRCAETVKNSLPVGAFFKRQVPLAHKVQHTLRRNSLEGRSAKGIGLASLAAVIVRVHRAVGKIGLAAAAYSQLAPRYGAALKQHNIQTAGGSMACAH